MATQTPPSNSQSYQFGTFAGVFTPSVLTILGVILFIRAGFVVGEAGVMGAILILILAKLITSLTALSVSAISTNMQVRGGGAYFLISRVLGPEFGGAIGLALFLAQALSVPFYILGFVEAVVASFPGLSPYFLTLSLSTALILFVVAFVSAELAIKAQYLIMALLFLALFTSFSGMIFDFSWARLMENWGPGYTPQTPGGPSYNFWSIFAIYFPAVTGILAGVNMSGDLKDASRSIPRGTLYALAVTFVIYLILIVLSGGSFERQALITQPYESLKGNALLGLTFTVAAGVYAASISSALGSYLGAPRILQAVARDRILGVIRPFAKGTARGDEPRRALLLTGLITLSVLWWAGNESGGGPLNAVASIITMFFLYTYGMINLAAFIEAYGRNPSFRPRFRFFHWSTALVAALACLGVALLIDTGAALIAAAVLACLFWYLQRQDLRSSFGDARGGFVYSNMRKNLLRLANLESHSKNWRPTILAFSGNPKQREALVSYAVWLEAGRGVVLLAHILPSGTMEQDARRRRMAQQHLREFARQNDIQAFPVVAIGDNLENTTAHLVQSTAIGPIQPNLSLFGWSLDGLRSRRLVRLLRVCQANGVSQVMVASPQAPNWVPRPPQGQRLFIDVWWRGRANGKLMIILAHLMTRNWEWTNTQIRVLRVVDDEAGLEPARKSLEELIEAARVDATVVTIVRGPRKFREILREQSSWSDCVFLGFEIPEEGRELSWHAMYQNLLQDMPPTILVHAHQDEDILT